MIECIASPIQEPTPAETKPLKADFNVFLNCIFPQLTVVLIKLSAEL